MNVGILGISFCGSTLLSYLLGANDKIFSVGESHWLIDSKGQRKCTICAGCEFYTEEFKISLKYDNIYKFIYDRAKEKYNVDIIIYSDKSANSYKKYMRYGNKIDKFIILFKRPQGFVRSYVSRMERKNLEYGTFENVLNMYYKHYIANTELSEKFDTITIFYEDLATQTVKILQYICNWLQVPYQDKMLQYWNKTEKTHQICGNIDPLLSFFSDEKFNTHKENNEWTRKIRKNIALDDRWKIYFSSEELKRIQNHQNSQSIFQKLMISRSIT